MTAFEMVREFHQKFGHPVATVPGLVNKKTIVLRMNLIEEELQELDEAMYDGNMVDIADALTDLLYVVYGTGHVYGIDLDKCFAEVHRSNMSKLGADGKPVLRSDGKILKGLNYTPPNLRAVLYPETT